MLEEKELKRYARQIQLPEVGIVGQEKLKQATVLIIGAGGLGCPVSQYLAASGIGNITIIDGDVVSESNLQRQILFSDIDVGKFKAKIASEKLKKQNPHIIINFFTEYITVDWCLKWFSSFDLIVDCTDNFGTRYLINDICVLLKKPFVAAALYRYEGQLSTYNVLQTNGTFSANYRQVFPENKDKKQALNCNEAGVFATLPGIMGMYEANEVLNFFINKENCLINKLLCINCREITNFVIDVTPSSNSNAKTQEEIYNSNYALPCYVKNKLLEQSIISFINKKENIIVDVRETIETPKLLGIPHITMPLSEIENRINELNNYKAVLFVCKSGVRSKKALGISEKKIQNVQCYSYQFGVEELINELKNNSK